MIFMTVSFRISKEVLNNKSTATGWGVVVDPDTSAIVRLNAPCPTSDLYRDPKIEREFPFSKPGLSAHVYAKWKERKLTEVRANEDRSVVFAELPSALSTEGINFLAVLEDAVWKLYFNKEPTTIEKAFALSIVGGVKMNLFKEVVIRPDSKEERANSLFFFTDAIQEGFCHDLNMSGEVVGEEALEEMFILKSASLKLVFGEEEAEPETATETKIVSEEITLDAIKEGRYRIFTPDELKDYPELFKDCIIPEFEKDETFSITPEFKKILRIAFFNLMKVKERYVAGKRGAEAIGDACLNFAFTGDPGTGKSYAGLMLGKALGLPVHVTTFNPRTTPSFAEGSTKMVDGKPTFVPSPMMLCHQYGGIGLLEEICLADPAVSFGVVSQMVVSPYTLTANDGTVITRNPFSLYIILYNQDAGSPPMHPALLNRFSQRFHFEAQEKEVFVNTLIAFNPKANYGRGRTVRRTCEWVYKAYSCVLTALDDAAGRDAMQAISMRSCFAVLNSIEAGEEPMEALRCLTDAIGDFDAELKRSVEQALKSSLRDLK
jgi:hypothetical protein